ncbi:MAG: MobF family relaxase [Acidimicrobiales bacterium]
MIVSVTPLGSRDGNAAGAATAVVRYLEGRCTDRGGHDPAPSPDLPTPDENAELTGYYADSMAAPGIWMGSGLTGVRMDGMIDSEQLQRVLVGQNPYTGDQLVGAAGSSQRAHADRQGPGLRGPEDELLTLPQASAALGVDPTYLRRRAQATQNARAVQARQQAAGEELTPLPSSYLDATREGNSHWQVTRGELRRFAVEREKPPVVVGYDITFSPPKSVSVLWATATPAQRVVIEAALTDAVRAGVNYLEQNGAHVRVSVRSDDGSGCRLDRQAATGLVGAAYLHDTSRALDPQLHFHYVAANMAEGPDGKVRALDGRSLFLHAKTAGYLSAAELRNRLSRELGVAWNKASRGVADIEGVPRSAILEMSQRSREINDHIDRMEEHKPTSARGRQIAAYDTRAAKEAPVDPDSLRPSWERRLAAVGFDRAAIDACYGRQRAPQLVDSVDRDELFRLMLGPTA